MNKLIFLGTGSASHPIRQMTAILYVTDDRAILMDCGDGMGTVRNIAAAGIPLTNVNDVVVTHRHADHIAGMPHFLFLKMLEKDSRVRVFGPRQTLSAVKTISFLTHDFTRDNRHRIAFVPVRPTAQLKLAPGVVLEAAKFKAGVGKSAQGYGYALTIGKKKITFTSDTQPCRAISRLASGSEILIHECFGLDRDREWIHSVGHSTARDAGELARDAVVSELILTHFPNEQMKNTAPEKLVQESRKYFSGKITAAHDLMEIGI